MKGLAPGGHLHALNGLQGCPGGILPAPHAIRGLAGCPGGVDPGAAAFVGEADEVGVGEPIFEGWKVRSLAVLEIQDLGALMVAQLLDGLGGGLLLRLRVPVQHVDLRVFQSPDGFPIGGIGNHAGCQDHQVHLHLDLLSQHGVLGRDGQAAIALPGYVYHLTSGKKDPLVLLSPPVEVLVLARRTHELEEDVGLGVLPSLSHIHGLLEGGHTADG